MSTDSVSRNHDQKDASVLQMLARLVLESERLIKLADDLENHASGPQAEAAKSIISTEINKVLHSFRETIEPLYMLYELDPGLKSLKSSESKTPPSAPSGYDENELWGDVKKHES